MTINHRAEAEKHLSQGSFVRGAGKPHPVDPIATDFHLRLAQVHATLARDEQQAATTADLREALHSLRRRFDDTRDLVAAHIACGLASREKDRWQAARDLAQALDKAYNNVDELIDARLSDDGWDPRAAWKTPASAVPADDPWAATPPPCVPGQEYSEPVETALRNLNRAGHVTPADTLTAARSVIAGHIAEALTDGENDDIRKWARSIADELKRIGVNLHGVIESRVEDLTGRPFSYDSTSPLGYSDEPPF
ncbi:hypothetical protein ABZ553_14480 [Streptomyces sparsogenes]|uniref:hypothetical protein n=1 Tax=Streptomyces sparsogenes TaxID=67365 RepID=UPI0033E6D681